MRPSTVPATAAPQPRRWPAPPFITASVALHAAAGGTALAVPGAWPWALAAVAANQAAITAAGLLPRAALLGPNVTRLPAAAARGALALTIDDGPDPEVTPRVLEALAALDVRATFFCVAERAATHPRLVREIVALGHSVQNHSHGHRHHFALLGPQGMRDEVARAQGVLGDLTGTAPHAFRAPAGLRNPFLDPALHALGLHLVSWTRRGYDTREADPVKVLARLARGLAAGDILLLHDGHARRTARGMPVLLEVLPPLVQQARAAGLRFETLREALPPRDTSAGAMAR